MTETYPIISADSHITEPPNTYIDFIDPAFRDRAPKLVDGGEQLGDIFVIDGMQRPIPMGLVAAAGKPAEEIRFMGVRFDDLHRSGWDPAARLADQERDGVSAEILYPTVGMQICNHRDVTTRRRASTPTTAGSPPTVPPTRRVSSAQDRRRSVHPRRASPTSRRSRRWAFGA
jgi:hypothetical protein